ncbi:hypothetical protein ScPMuIL_015252 [Solemya velum]
MRDVDVTPIAFNYSAKTVGKTLKLSPVTQLKMDLEALTEKLEKYGQNHVLQYWESLSEPQQVALYTQLNSINYRELTSNFGNSMQYLMSSTDNKLDQHLMPLPTDVCGSTSRCDSATILAYQQKGLTEIGNSNVAVLLLAGGQGTRLGVNYPKGMYNVNLPSGKTLYQLQAERIYRVQELAAGVTGKPCTVPWYIMTSEHTKEPTEAFFEKHDHFGLKKENVILFEQHLLPTLSFDGRIIMESKHKISLAPDGNGGLYRALREHGIIDDMVNRGIQFLHVYCVDNILVKMADPVFIGFCLSKGVECGAKVVEKAFPTEPVGVVCKVHGQYQVVEYSEITLNTAEQRNADGRLTFNAGNICNHFFTIQFLKNVCGKKQENQLKYHVAKKKIAFINQEGQTEKPTSPNGIKMEKFVFDVFHFATSFAVWEVLREDEFSPLKNADGAAKDTPTTCRHSVFDLHRRYLLSAGAKFTEKGGVPISDIPSRRSGEFDEANIICEISPLVSYAGEQLESVVEGKTLVAPLHIEKSSRDGSISIVTNGIGADSS